MEELMIRKIAGMCFFVLSCTACTSTLPVAGNNQAVVIVQREKKSRGDGILIKLFIDEKEITSLRNGKKTNCIVEKGRREVKIVWTGGGVFENKLIVDAGDDVLHLNIIVTNTGFELFNETMPLKFDGVYYYETKWLTMYLRFFEDGRVISANVAGKVKSGFERWFTADYTHNAGSYSLENGRIKFTTLAAEGDIDYEGTIDRKGLVLNWQSRINDHAEKKLLYHFKYFQGNRVES
jgi:hypothetical protein